MHPKRVLVVLLPGKTAKDDGASFVVEIFPGDRCSVRQERYRPSRLIFHFELFLEPCRFELGTSPLDLEFFAGDQLLFPNAQHFVPPETGNFRFGMASFIHPPWPGFDKKMSASRNVCLQNCGFLIRQHQRIRDDHESVSPKVILGEFSRTEDLNRKIPFEKHSVVSGHCLMNRIPAAFLIVAT